MPKEDLVAEKEFLKSVNLEFEFANVTAAGEAVDHLNLNGSSTFCSPPLFHAQQIAATSVLQAALGDNFNLLYLRDSPIARRYHFQPASSSSPDNSPAKHVITLTFGNAQLLEEAKPKLCPDSDSPPAAENAISTCQPYAYLGLYLFIDALKWTKTVKAEAEHPDQLGAACTFALGSTFVTHLQHSPALMQLVGLVLGGDNKANVVPTLNSVNWFGQAEFWNSHPLTVQAVDDSSSSSSSYLWACIVYAADSMGAQYFMGATDPNSLRPNPNSPMLMKDMRQPSRQIFDKDYLSIHEPLDYISTAEQGAMIELLRSVGDLKVLIKRTSLVCFLIEAASYVELILSDDTKEEKDKRAKKKKKLREYHHVARYHCYQSVNDRRMLAVSYKQSVNTLNTISFLLSFLTAYCLVNIAIVHS